MPQATEISFVVYPDGKVDEKSLTIAGESFARELFISGWLPERFFGASPRGYAADSIWRGRQETGFKAYTIQLEKELCATGCGGEAVWGNSWTQGRMICRDCFDGWYECGITRPSILKLRSVMLKAGAADDVISAAIEQAYAADVAKQEG